ncbi:MAG: hypothetical protein JSW51_03050 [Gemmatimonadota bacterium]|nr:MAG: hypothetical protein EP299_01725 [Acidobacteriota bacterium]UCD24912.1 MAG: hypothetical protein JSW51_03050 [Gemmatimonadota bacterium]
MFPHILMAAIASLVITPGEVPVVAEPHPDETAYVEELKQARPAPAPIVLVAQASPFPDNYHYPPETVDAILRTYFPTEEGLTWARLVGFCESSWDINAVGAVGEIGWFQHRPEYWAYRSELAGYPGGDIWNPEINTAVAAFMYYSPDFGKGHWTCTRKVGL